MDILFTDLDNTLIYSRKINIEEKITVEIYNDEENSFMSKLSFNILQELFNKMLLIPVTTRTIAQYSRINMGIKPKYALCANGGILLKDGFIDKKWYNETLGIVSDSQQEREKAFKYLERDKRRNFECRNIEDLFIFTKCEKTHEVAEDLKEVLDPDLVEVLYNGSKLYILPKKLNKGDMAKRLLKSISKDEFDSSRDQIFAAGDTEFDLSIIKFADTGFAHKDLNYYNDKNIINNYNGLFSDFYLEEILKLTDKTM